MGSIPATLDISLRSVRRRINKINSRRSHLKSINRNLAYSFHTQCHSKSSYYIFFSYESLSSYNSQKVQSFWWTFNFFQYKTHRFVSLVYSHKRSPLLDELNLLQLSFSQFTPQGPCFSLAYPLLNVPYGDYSEFGYSAELFSEKKVRTFTSLFKNLYATYRLQVYLDNTDFLYTFLNLRSLQSLLQFSTQRKWSLDAFFGTLIVLNRHLQDFNLRTKSQFRQYFKFYNYWFEYSRLSSLSHFEVTRLRSVFSMNSIGFNGPANTNFNASKLSFRTDISNLPHTLLRYTTFKLFNKSIYIQHRSPVSLNFKDLLPYSYRSQGQLTFNTVNLATSDTITFRKRRQRLTTSFNYKLPPVFWNKRQQSYLFRNRSWKYRLKAHQIYQTSFQWSRKLRNQCIFRKVISKIVRVLSMSNLPLVTIFYQSLVFTQTLAHLLTNGSSVASYQDPVYLSSRRTSNIYSGLNRYTEQVVLYLIHESLGDSYSETSMSRWLQSVTDHTPKSNIFILPFASSNFFVNLLIPTSLITWKYSLAFSLFICNSRLLLSSPSPFRKFISQTLNSVLLSQAHVYNSTSLLRYITYSNLSLLNLEECYALTPIRKFIDSKVLRYYSAHYMRPNGFFWYYTTLIQFLEDTTGRKVVLNFGPFLETALTFSDRARCLMWGSRILGFQRILGPKIFIHEALEVLVTSIRLKDPTFLANWIRAMLIRMSFWKYRLIFRYLKFLLHNLIRESFSYFNFKGAKFRLKGKISVAGNARTRMILYRVGSTTHTTMANRVSYDLSYVNTFTGIQGFKIWFFY